MDVHHFIKAVLAQDEDTIRSYFHKDAYVNWHCSNEHFTVDEFIIANCEYPGDWDGTIERVEQMDNLYITATKVYPKDRSADAILKEAGFKISLTSYQKMNEIRRGDSDSLFGLKRFLRTPDFDMNKIIW